MDSIDNQLGLMERYRLTAEEVLVTELLFLASIEEQHPEYLKRYLALPTIKTKFRDLLISLQEKGVILKSFKIPNTGEIFDPEAVEFNKNFLHGYRKYSGELGIEFLQEYPSIAIINGTEAPLKNYAKKFKTEEEFYFAYGKAIGWKLDEHNRVMDIVKWGKENNCRLLNMNIADFVVSKMWNSVQELRDGDGVMTFDPVEIV